MSIMFWRTSFVKRLKGYINCKTKFINENDFYNLRGTGGPLEDGSGRPDRDHAEAPRPGVDRGDAFAFCLMVSQNGLEIYKKIKTQQSRNNNARETVYQKGLRTSFGFSSN